MEWVVGAWAIVVAVVALNLCAAGVAGIMHAWRSKTRRGGRILAATAVSGSLPGSIFIVAGLVEAGWPTSSAEEPLVMAGAVAMVMGLGMLVSLPGAAIVARKLEAPGEDYRTFE